MKMIGGKYVYYANILISSELLSNFCENLFLLVVFKIFVDIIILKSVAAYTVLYTVYWKIILLL